tara:strand:- start:111 stop:278 length:168 start_codon:yes stop_codon:yes gene_type:complete
MTENALDQVKQGRFDKLNEGAVVNNFPYLSGYIGCRTDNADWYLFVFHCDVVLLV